MTFHETLDSALSDIAGRSFYDDATVTPVEGGYEVTEDFSTAYAGDAIPWTYDGGMKLPGGILNNSRLNEPNEFYNDVRHIRYHMASAIKALETGHTITFAYAIVKNLNYFNSSGDTLAECEDCQCDRTVGWVLLAYDYGPMA